MRVHNHVLPGSDDPLRVLRVYPFLLVLLSLPDLSNKLPLCGDNLRSLHGGRGGGAHTVDLLAEIGEQVPSGDTTGEDNESDRAKRAVLVSHCSACTGRTSWWWLGLDDTLLLEILGDYRDVRALNSHACRCCLHLDSLCHLHLQP